jgi:hypothetical protein
MWPFGICILWLFGKFFPNFGILYQDNSGNRGSSSNSKDRNKKMRKIQGQYSSCTKMNKKNSRRKKSRRKWKYGNRGGCQVQENFTPTTSQAQNRLS